VDKSLRAASAHTSQPDAICALSSHPRGLAPKAAAAAARDNHCGNSQYAAPGSIGVALFISTDS
jgi:hypothetical protein